MKIDPSKFHISQNSESLFRFYETFNNDLNRQEENIPVKEASKFVECVIARAMSLTASVCKGFDEEKYIITNGIIWFNALADYIEDKFALEPTYFEEHAGKKFSELPPMLQRRIKETNVTYKIIQYGDKEHMDMLCDFMKLFSHQ